MNGVTTEWFDLQVKYGNFLPNEEKTTLLQEQTHMQEKKKEEDKLENRLDRMNEEQIDQLEDDLDFEDEFTKKYMANRLQELKVKATKNKFGSVLEISRNEFIREVTEADPESFVVLHLYQTSNQFCNLINMHLQGIAQRYGHVKFIKIESTKCIQNFPDSRCPCFIIYKAGKVVSHLTNVDKIMKGDIKNIDVMLGSQSIHPL